MSESYSICWGIFLSTRCTHLSVFLSCPLYGDNLSAMSPLCPYMDSPDVISIFPYIGMSILYGHIGWIGSSRQLDIQSSRPRPPLSRKCVCAEFEVGWSYSICTYMGIAVSEAHGKPGLCIYQSLTLLCPRMDSIESG